jgi:glycosyltransferase involved in cell wall biosynthesis
VEAFASGKAVVTCTDSGGPTELVADGVNGRVVAPDAPALAAALGGLMDDAPLAERLGAAARSQADAMTWDRALERLLLVQD